MLRPFFSLSPARFSSICTISIFNRVYPAVSPLFHTLHVTFSLLSFLRALLNRCLTIPTAIFHTCAMDYDLLNRKRDRRKNEQYSKKLVRKIL